MVGALHMTEALILKAKPCSVCGFVILLPVAFWFICHLIACCILNEAISAVAKHHNTCFTHRFFWRQLAQKTPLNQLFQSKPQNLI